MAKTQVKLVVLPVKSIKEIQKILKTAILSMEEGYDGTWDSTGEGKEGFLAVRDQLHFAYNILKEA